MSSTDATDAHLALPVSAFVRHAVTASPRQTRSLSVQTLQPSCPRPRALSAPRRFFPRVRLLLASRPSRLAMAVAAQRPPQPVHTLHPDHMPAHALASAKRDAADKLNRSLESSRALTLASLLEHPVEFVAATSSGLDDRLPYQPINVKVSLDPAMLTSRFSRPARTLTRSAATIGHSQGQRHPVEHRRLARRIHFEGRAPVSILLCLDTLTHARRRLLPLPASRHFGHLGSQVPCRRGPQQPR